MSDINDRAHGEYEGIGLAAGMDRGRVLRRPAPERDRAQLLRLKLLLPPATFGHEGLRASGFPDLQAGAQLQGARPQRREGLSRNILGYAGA